MYEDYRKSVVAILSKISNLIDYYSGEIALPTQAIISMDENNSKVLQITGISLYYNISELLCDVDAEKVIKACENPLYFIEIKQQMD